MTYHYKLRSLPLAVALTTGLGAMAAAPASASSVAYLDFTTGAINAGSASGNILGTTYGVSATNGTLVDATHKTDAGCDIADTPLLACDGSGNTFDVGFGVDGTGPNDNEIDGRLSADESVDVKFGKALRITGFAALLTYSDSQHETGTEKAMLDVFLDGVLQGTHEAFPIFSEADGSGGGDFNTAGLAFNFGFNTIGDSVSFRADGIGDGDDGNVNVTAAALKVTAVPLPAAGWLMLAGFGGLAALRRRKRTA